MPLLSLIAWVAENGVIGADGGMPLRLSSDLKRFRRLTMGRPVVMGRRTYVSIGRPLDGRPNLVVSRDPDFAPAGVLVFRDLDGAIDAALALAAEGGLEEAMVIGGGAVYAEAIGRADRLHITHVDAAPAGDTRFPPIDPAIWAGREVEALPAGPRDEAATRYVVYDRRRDLLSTH